LVGEARRSLDQCRPAAISGALEAISRLTVATRRSLSFACAAVSGPLPARRSDKVVLPTAPCLSAGPARSACPACPQLHFTRAEGFGHGDHQERGRKY